MSEKPPKKRGEVINDFRMVAESSFWMGKHRAALVWSMCVASLLGLFVWFYDSFFLLWRLDHYWNFERLNVRKSTTQLLFVYEFLFDGMPTGFQNVPNKTTSTGRKSNLIPCFPPLVSQSSECRVPIILHDLILFNCEVERRKKNHKNAVHPLKTEREKERKKKYKEKNPPS